MLISVVEVDRKILAILLVVETIKAPTEVLELIVDEVLPCAMKVTPFYVVASS